MKRFPPRLPTALVTLALCAACGGSPSAPRRSSLVPAAAVALGRPLAVALLAAPNADAADAGAGDADLDGRPSHPPLARDCAALLLTVETLHAVATEGAEWQELAASPAWQDYEAAADRYHDCDAAAPAAGCGAARAAVADAWDAVAATPELAAARDTTLGRALAEVMAHGETLGCWETEG